MEVAVRVVVTRKEDFREGDNDNDMSPQVFWFLDSKRMVEDIEYILRTNSTGDVAESKLDDLRRRANDLFDVDKIVAYSLTHVGTTPDEHLPILGGVWFKQYPEELYGVAVSLYFCSGTFGGRCLLKDKIVGLGFENRHNDGEEWVDTKKIVEFLLHNSKIKCKVDFIERMYKYDNKQYEKDVERFLFSSARPHGFNSSCITSS